MQIHVGLIECDPAKDEANIRKRGVSLGRALDLESLAVLPDDRTDEALKRAAGV